VHPDDADALVDAMRRLADPVTAASLGADALARSADASWPRVAGRILAAVGLADVPASEPAAARSEEARP
jgi:hypothetical protein